MDVEVYGRIVCGQKCLVWREPSMGRNVHTWGKTSMGRTGELPRGESLYTPKLGLMKLLHIGNCRLNLILLAVVASVKLFVAVNSQMFTRFPESSVEPYQLLYVNWNFINVCISNLVFYMMCSGQPCYLTGATIIWEVFYPFVCSDWQCTVTILCVCSWVNSLLICMYISVLSLISLGLVLSDIFVE